VGASFQPSQEALLFGKLEDQVIEKEFEGCSTIYNAGMVPCALQQRLKKEVNIFITINCTEEPSEWVC